jgi:hypothetical protein
MLHCISSRTGDLVQLPLPDALIQAENRADCPFPYTLACSSHAARVPKALALWIHYITSVPGRMPFSVYIQNLAHKAIFTLIRLFIYFAHRKCSIKIR